VALRGYPSSDAGFARATFSHKGRRKKVRRASHPAAQD
jgi:hypothetical protein